MCTALFVADIGARWRTATTLRRDGVHVLLLHDRSIKIEQIGNGRENKIVQPRGEGALPIRAPIRIDRVARIVDEEVEVVATRTKKFRHMPNRHSLHHGCQTVETLQQLPW